jgi:uncharacterized membrane protein
MDGLFVLLGILIALEVLGLPILAVLYLSERARVAQRLNALTDELARLRSAMAGTAKPQAEPTSTTAPAPTEAVATPAAPAPTVAAPAAPAPAPSRVVAAASNWASAKSSAAPGATPAVPRESLEERVMRRWAVWLGGVALAFGAYFLVKFSIEQGWFGPLARVCAGGALGLALWALGEWVRQRDLRLPLPGGAPDAIPPALAAAGSVALFASLYAAHGLYHLLNPLAALVLLALVSAATVLLSLLHGQFMAWLGIAGAYVVPLIVTTPHPSIPGLLGYVAIVTAGSTAVMRWRGWSWLAWLALGGAVLWALAAIGAGGEAELLWPLGLYLLVLPLLFLLVADAVSEGAPGVRHAAAWAAAIIAALLMFALVQIERTDTVTLGFAGVLSAGLAALAWRYPRVDRLVWISAALQAAVIAGWDFPVPPGTEADQLHLLMVPPVNGTGSYLGMATLLGVAYGLGGFALLSRVPNPARWAIASAATPLLLAIAAYGRLEHFAVSLPWAVVALGLGILALLAAESLALAARESRKSRLALAVYAVAMTAGVSLAVTMTFRLKFLTLALALELPALGWINRRISTRAFRVIAGVVAAVVLVRLLLNPSLIDYELNATPVVNDLLYLYGVPAAAFALAAWLFRREREDVTVALLEAGALALALALVSLEIHHWALGGRLSGGVYGLLEQGLQSSSWLAVAYLLARRSLGIDDRLREIAWRVIAGVAALHVVLITVLLSNPLLSSVSAGHGLILDPLLVAYALPAVLAALFARELLRRRWRRLAIAAAVGALALGFLYLSLETRHWFQGEILNGAAPSTAEWYAYSAVWLVYGAALLCLGIWRGAAALRLAGLAIGALVAVKAFVFDMAALTGLYRAASFLGLGGSVVALAYLYQRLIARTSSPNAADAGPADDRATPAESPAPPG